MRRTLLLSALVLAAGIGCLTPTQRREEELVTNARLWNDDFRWGRWAIVGQSMPAEESRLLQERCSLVDNDLLIADYEVTSIRFLQQSQAATVDVNLEWYRKTDPTLRHAALQQRWEQQAGRWLMVRQRRVRGDRFPLVPEPAQEKDAPAAAGAPDKASRPESP